jgi:hypothetical protein
MIPKTCCLDVSLSGYWRIVSCASYLCCNLWAYGRAVNSCCNQPTTYVCFQNPSVANAAASTTSIPSIADSNQLAYQTTVDIIESCESATSSFDNLDDTVLASCLCHSGANYASSAFDKPLVVCHTAPTLCLVVCCHHILCHYNDIVVLVDKLYRSLSMSLTLRG